MIDKRPPSESEVGANFTPPRPTGRGGKGGRGAVSEGAWGQAAGGAGESLPDTPTRHPLPDTPTRHPDSQTQKGRFGVCKRMQGDAKGEKPMQADARGCKRKSKEVGGKGSGQGAGESLPSPKGAKGQSLGGFSVVFLSVVVYSAKALLRFWLGCSPLPL